jgi:hypothetical protein
MRLPPHWEGHKVQLYKTLYGLDIAPKGWYLECSGYLKSIGWEQQAYEPGLFHKVKKCESTGEDITLTLSLYVDDMIITSLYKKFLDEEVKKIKDKWKITTADIDKYRRADDLPTTNRYDVLGAEVEYDPIRRYLKIHCSKYIGKLLEKFKKSSPDLRTANSPCDQGVPDLAVGKERDDFPIRELVGGLGHLVQVCRPDIAYSVSRL